MIFVFQRFKIKSNIIKIPLKTKNFLHSFLTSRKITNIPKYPFNKDNRELFSRNRMKYENNRTKKIPTFSLWRRLFAKILSKNRCDENIVFHKVQMEWQNEWKLLITDVFALCLEVVGWRTSTKTSEASPKQLGVYGGALSPLRGTQRGSNFRPC